MHVEVAVNIINIQAPTSINTISVFDVYEVAQRQPFHHSTPPTLQKPLRDHINSVVEDRGRGSRAVIFSNPIDG